MNIPLKVSGALLWLVSTPEGRTFGTTCAFIALLLLSSWMLYGRKMPQQSETQQ